MIHSVWIDTDPGFDDLTALLLAHFSPHINLLGIGVVAGNAPLATTLNNTLRIAEFFGIAAPIYAGAQQPLLQTLSTAENILGAGALGTIGQSLPEAQTVRPQNGHAALRLIEAAQQQPGQITLVAIGPLTNVALALRLEPRLAHWLKDVIIMGGSSDRGNHTAAAEFNIWADPEAAHVLLSSGITPKVFGLNLTRQVLLQGSHIQAIREASAVLADHMEHYLRIRDKTGKLGMPFHDPTTVAYLLWPELFELQAAHVSVEIVGEYSRGMTVCEFRVPQRGEPNAWVATQAQGQQVMHNIVSLLQSSL